MAEAPKSFDCPKCGRRYYDAQRFCLDCGLDFREAFRVCPRCKGDTPRLVERCVVCDCDLVAYDMRRPKIIVGLILIAVIFAAIAVPYWWFHTPAGKRHGTIIKGEIYMLNSDNIEFVPMFYEYQSGQKALGKAEHGGWQGMTGGMDASRILPLPPPTIPYVPIDVGERVYVTRKTRDSDGNRWFHIRRYEKDVIRKGWVHEMNIKFE